MNLLKFKLIIYLSYSTARSSSSPLRLGSYLAGLIEGDGTIIVPSKDKSEKGKTYYPIIRIVFTINDLPLVEKLQKVIGHGRIQKGKGQFYLLATQVKEGSINGIDVIYGYMRTP